MASQLKTWVVDFDADAVIDFEGVKSRGDRKAVFNVVQKLKDGATARDRVRTRYLAYGPQTILGHRPGADARHDRP